MGDPARGIPYAFEALNRGKRSLAVDLKAEGAAELVLRLAARSDVLLESFRPGVMDRLGLGDEALERASPRLVRCSLVGYGAGPLRDEPGHDINYEALAGILATQGPPARPAESGVPVADLAGASYSAIGILAALLERERTGKGRRVEVALGDAALAFHAVTLQRAAAGEPLPGRGAWELGGGLPGYRLYRCGDGRFLALGALEDKFWRRFTTAVARPDLEERHLDPTAVPAVEALLAGGARDAWVERLRAAGVPATPVLEPAEALAHPQHARFAGRVGPAAPLTHAPAPGRAPALGEHTDDVLREAGLPENDIAQLRARGVVA